MAQGRNFRSTFDQTKPPLERDIAGIRYISLDAAVSDRFCSRKRAYALARDPRYSIVTERWLHDVDGDCDLYQDIQLTTCATEHKG